MSAIIGFLFLCGLISYLSGWRFWTVAAVLVGSAIAAGVIKAVVSTSTLSKRPQYDFVIERRASPEEQEPDPARIERHGGKARDDIPPDDRRYVRNARVGIEYRDWGDQNSERYIVPASFTYRVSRDGRVFVLQIDAFCELRHEHRTFRYHRVLNAYDVETGEVIDNLGAFLWARQGEY